MLPILYSFRRCPYAIRARYTIATLGVPVSLREVALKAKPESLLALGGRSSVPQLIDTDGTRYPESLDIIYWALSQISDQPRADSLWPSSAIQQNKMRAWITYNDRFFKHWLDRYKYADRHLEHTEEYYRQRGEVFLKRLEKRLAKNTYLFGETMTLADIAIFPFIRQFAGVNSTWFEASEYKKVREWLTGFLDSELFQMVMTKFPKWEEGEESPLFPMKSSLS